MAIKLTTTSESINCVKALAYGESGVGKTWLCQTAPSPVIISAEKGLLTLKNVKIPVIEISSFQDLEEAYHFIVGSEHAKDFKTVCLDSITDIAETILGEEKLNAGRDPRQAYGAYADKLLPMIKKFRDLSDRNVYFTAKMKRMTDDFTGITSFGPSMPGQQLGQNLPYLFDFCLAIRIGVTEEGVKYRYLQTEGDIQYVAKARGGMLDNVEEPHLGKLFNKALGIEESKPEKKKKKAEPKAEDKKSEAKSSEQKISKELLAE